MKLVCYTKCKIKLYYSSIYFAKYMLDYSNEDLKTRTLQTGGGDRQVNYK